ncbi:MAG: acyl-CoA dehydrogenase family protein [SAR324 cluster bacterium]|nr:acyl-CoA dehydrogenase family protein [SAR324 cluster bacterium]
MDFSFTPEQNAIRDLARQFARTRLAPEYRNREKQGRLERGLFEEMGQLGFIAAGVSEELGGQGLDGVSVGIIVEEISYGDLNAAYITVLGGLNAAILEQHGSPELSREWLPRLCSGEISMALALTEPHAGSDAARLKLKATKQGGSYLLNGEKTSISFADQADLCILFARTGAEEDGAGGVSVFLVPLDLPGVSRTRFEDLGSRAVGRGSLFFDDVTLPAEMMLGEPGRGFSKVMRGFDFSRALIGLQCLAPAAASLAETWPYVVERKAFGASLASFEGVSFPLAEAETLLSAATLLCYKTLWQRDQGMPHTAEAAMCKWWAPKLAFEVIQDCLLMHGHAGYSEDFPHQQRLRDVLGLQIGDGTAQIMKMIIAREKVGRVAVPY